MTQLNTAFTLPCGISIPNRLAKAAMTEGVADKGGVAGDRAARLYQTWAEGGVGVMITGNIMVDRRYRERPANIIVDGEQSEAQIDGLRSFAAAAKTGGGVAIAQISHAGRQTPAIIAPEPVGPSAVEVKLPGGVFGTPRALSSEEIEDVIARFASTAKTLCEAGFDGVQVHAAHGYLISEFLNPLVNQRADDWGGSLENRARILIETVRAVRTAIGAGKVLSVKLNSSDFQKGGFSFEDCKRVVAMLDAESIDLLEISGGNYEQPRMMGMDGMEPAFEGEVRESTRAREAYFMAYAEEIIGSAKTPIMVTGGFRTRQAMEEALEAGVAVLGIARPLCVHTDAPKQLLDGSLDALPTYEQDMALGSGYWGPASPNDLIKAANAFAILAFFYRNILRLADGKPAKTKMSMIGALIAHQMQDRRDAKTH